MVSFLLPMGWIDALYEQSIRSWRGFVKVKNWEAAQKSGLPGKKGV